MPDVRTYQIASLATLLAYGMTQLGFDIDAPRVCLILATTLATQAFCDLLAAPALQARPAVNIRSALISGLSLCLLLRTNRPELAVAAAVITIAGKFVIKVRGKHVFNPTNGGLVAMLLLTNGVWVSPGQWGTAAYLAFLIACAGVLVVNRASRSDITYAFIACYTALIVGRSLYLGEPMTIPLHRLQSGALLLFAFFMISDPRTSPDSRMGRVLFAALVASLGWYIQFRLFRTNGLLWSLALCAPTVPIIDALVAGERYVWNRKVQGSGFALHGSGFGRQEMRRLTIAALIAVILPASTMTAFAFCGFYVSKADTTLFNKASQVVLVRDGDRTVMTMVNDFKGDLKEFAVVIPVPTVLQRGQIHVGDKALVDHIDAYSAPRLVEYFDSDPCRPILMESFAVGGARSDRAAPLKAGQASANGVTIEAQYSVGEYDILILSAQESTGLETWLRDNGYRIPAGASSVIASYLRQNMRFFVAKVNLKAQATLGFSYLRPLQIAYESPKFMLPIRLGMVNAAGPQDLIVYALTKNGRVEPTNYRTVKLPSDMDVPEYFTDTGEFPAFYKAMFTHQADVEQNRAVFVEYAWNMRWCDPCAADPLSNDELRQLGVYWTDNVFLTRLHVRYDRAHFPEDLVFQETGNQENFQGRYVVRHEFTGPTPCQTAASYHESVRQRRERAVQQVVVLTGWEASTVRRKAGLDGTDPGQAANTRWWEKLWGR